MLFARMTLLAECRDHVTRTSLLADIFEIYLSRILIYSSIAMYFENFIYEIEGFQITTDDSS